MKLASMKFGSRVFSPRPFTTLLAIVLIAVLASLGRWQLRRAAEKQVMVDAFDRGADATRVVRLETAPLPRYQHVEARGAYDASRQILIDNMTDAHGRAGYFVITPFALSTGGWMLVNRGWVSGRKRPALCGNGLAEFSFLRSSWRVHSSESSSSSMTMSPKASMRSTSCWKRSYHAVELSWRNMMPWWAKPSWT